MSQQSTEKDFSDGEDSSSVEEEVPGESSETEDPVESFAEGPESILERAAPSPWAGRCCSLKADSLVVLEFKPTSQRKS